MRRLLTVLLLTAISGAVQLRAQAQPKTEVAETGKGTTVVEPPVIGPRDPIFGPVATSGKPQTQQERLGDYMVETFGPRSLMGPAFSAGFRSISPKSHYPREWKFGAEAFGRNYGDAYAGRVSEQTARYVTAALLHEDFRYRPSVSTSPVARLAHAVAFTFVDRSDSGANRLAVSNFAAAGARGLVGVSYLPTGYDDLSHAGSRAAIAFAGLAGQNVAREFAPDLFKLTRKLHIPFPRVPLPEWWVKRK